MAVSLSSFVTASLISVSALATPVSSSTIGYWNFDEGSGNVLLDANATTSHHGQHFGNPAYITSPRGGFAVFYDGVDDKTEIPTPPTLGVGSGSFTLEMVVRFESNAGVVLNRRSDLSTVSGYQFGAFGGPPPYEIQWGIGDGVTPYATVTHDLPNPVDDGEYHYLAMMREVTGSTNLLRLFFDGVQVAGIAPGFPPGPDVDASAVGSLDTPAPIILGQVIVPGLFFKRVTFDDLRISTTALSAAEIAANAQRVLVDLLPLVDESSSAAIAGLVSADCPSEGTPLLGVQVDAFEMGSGDLVGVGVTDADGSYGIGNLPPGAYTITVVSPLGYTTPSADVPVTLASGENTTIDYALDCVTVTSSPRGGGFWKHQVGVATGGNGNAQISSSTLCSYLDLISAHFNDNAVNQVVVYQAPTSGICADKLQVAKSLLNLPGSSAMADKARQHLLALLLNVAAGYIGLTQVISADGATVSQAITHCDHLIDNPAGDHVLAKVICEQVNSGQLIPAGSIPLGTENIAYASRRGPLDLRIDPNPAAGSRVFRFSLSSPGNVDFAIYDLAGRHVAELHRGFMLAGRHSLRWNGVSDSHAALGNGVYLARLSIGSVTHTVKLVQFER